MKRLLLLPLILVLLSSACSRRTEPEGAVLKLGNGSEPESLDPHLTTGVPEYRIISALMEGLIREDKQELKPIPGAAERWEVSEDGLQWRFYLREDGKWSNGDPVTAADFVFSYRRMLSSELAAEYAYMLYVFKNGEKLNKGEVQPEELGVSAEGDFVLHIELEKPAPYFLSMLNHHSFYPVHPGTVEAGGDPLSRENRWARLESYVGNGPFQLSEWKLNERISVVPNPQYWNKDALKLDAIEFYPIDDELAEERMFRAGELHATSTVPQEKIPRYREEGNPNYRNYPYLTTYYYLINSSRKPFDDVRVRKALSLSIQRELITEQVLRAGQKPALWFTPVGAAGFSPSQQLQEDVDEAKRLLAEAGYPGGEGFPKFTLLYNTSESHRKLAQVVQQMWKEHLGIECELQNQEWQVYMVTRRELDFDIARAGWAGDYVDPHNFLDLHLSSSGNNHTGWSSERYDALIQEAAGTQDTDKRYALYDQAEAILLEEMPLIPVYWYTSNRLVSEKVTGWNENLLDKQDYTQLGLEAE